MPLFRSDDLIPYAKGCALLGSGGGGDVRYRLFMAQGALEHYGPVMVIDELDDDDLVVPLAFLGAPLVSKEKLPALKSFEKLIERIEQYYGQKVKALMPAEIGGGNGLTPFCIAGRLGLPLFDADLMGRAFPTLTMTVAHLAGFSPAPVFLADALGQTVVVEDNPAIEQLVRAQAVAMGSQCAIAAYIMKGSDTKKAVLKGSISQALKSPQGRLLAKESAILNISSSIEGGFLKGKVLLEGDIEVFFQNEYLLAKRGDQILGLTPDILCLLDRGTPVSTDALRFGLPVELVLFEAPPIWKTEKGLKLSQGVL